MNRIKEIRKEKGLTQKALAVMAGISQPYLNDLENGNRHGRKATLERIAAPLGVAVEALTASDEKDNGAA